MDCLDYTFRNNKAKISSSNNTTINIKNKNQPKLNEYIYDLENTITLNQEFISNFISINDKLTQPQKNLLKQRIDKIKNYFNLKKNIHNEMNKLNGKILINKQIIEETKRRNDENFLYYRDQIEEFSENVNKKTSLVKQFQKKFSEVEIFIQRECKNPEHNEKYNHWKHFTIVPFMNKNETLLKKKSYLEMIVNKKLNETKNILDENKKLKKEKNIANNKYQKLTNHYDNKIKYYEHNIEIIKMLLNRIYENDKKEMIPPFVKLDISEDELQPINLLEKKNYINGDNIIQYDKQEEESEDDENMKELPPPDEQFLKEGSKNKSWGNISFIEKEDI